MHALIQLNSLLNCQVAHRIEVALKATMIGSKRATAPKLLHHFGLEILDQLPLQLVVDVLGEGLEEGSDCRETQHLTDVLEGDYLGTGHRLDQFVAVAKLEKEDEFFALADPWQSQGLSWLRIEHSLKELRAHLLGLRTGEDFFHSELEDA